MGGTWVNLAMPQNWSGQRTDTGTDEN